MTLIDDTLKVFNIIDKNRIENAIVLVDDQVADALESIGGLQIMLSRGASTVMRLIGSEMAVVEWWKLSGIESPNVPIRLLFIVSEPLNTCNDYIVSILKAQYNKKPWIRATIYSCLDAQAQGSEAKFDFKDFALKLQTRSRPNACEIQVLHLPWNVQVHLNDLASRVAVFSLLADYTSRKLFPITLNRVALVDQLSDIADLDANSHLSDAYKGQLKRVAQVLQSVLGAQFGLNVTANCWAQGMASRIIGNAILDYSEGKYDHAQNAKLILIDRTLDLTSAMRQGNTLQQIANSNSMFEETFEAYFDPRSLPNAANESVNALLYKLLKTTPDTGSKLISCPHQIEWASSKSQTTVETALKHFFASMERDPAWFQKIDTYKFIVQLLVAQYDQHALEQYTVLENIVLNSTPDQIFPVLIDVMNRNPMEPGLLIRLLIISFAAVGTIPKSHRDWNSISEYKEICLRAISDYFSRHQTWPYSKQVKSVLTEIMNSSQSENTFSHSSNEAYLISMIRSAISGGESHLMHLGASSLQQTAEDIEKTARTLFNAFGFGGGPKQKKQYLRLVPGDTCVVFVIGGISYHEIECLEQTIVPLAPGIQFLVGGTSIATQEEMVKHLFQVIGHNANWIPPQTTAAHMTTSQGRDKNKSISNLF